MVHVTDDGIFDAPVEKVWKYINDENGHAHSAVKFTKVLEQNDKGMTAELEVKHPDGSSHMETWKMTMNPPKSHLTEVLAGPMKGSKYTHTYTPMGNKTKVQVEGDFTGQGMDDASTKKAVLSMFEMVYNEDNANLRNYK
jgi:ligand-binding SRPBCC domain-containing protein